MKIIAITKELQTEIEHGKRKKTIQQNIVLDNNSFQTIQQLKKCTEIHIYDVLKETNKKKKNQIVPINNHINKTGQNIIQANKIRPIRFYDITEIYQQTKKGKTAECFGLQKPTKKQKRNYIKTGFLCQHAICAAYFKIKKIYGYVIV